MKKTFRLTHTSDFTRVKRDGRSFAHPLLVMYAIPSGEKTTRVGIRAGRWMGSAVDRNRAKRMLREALRHLHSNIATGNDLLMMTRAPLLTAKLDEIEAALESLLQRAKLYRL